MPVAMYRRVGEPKPSRLSDRPHHDRQRVGKVLYRSGCYERSLNKIGDYTVTIETLVGDCGRSQRAELPGHHSFPGSQKSNIRRLASAQPRCFALWVWLAGVSRRVASKSALILPSERRVDPFKLAPPLFS